MTRKVDQLAARVYAETRQRILRALAGRHETELAQIYKQAAADIRRRLRVTTATEATVERVMREAFERAVDRVLPLVEAQIVAGAGAGVEAAARTLHLVAPPPGEVPFPLPPRSGRRRK